MKIKPLLKKIYSLFGPSYRVPWWNRLVRCLLGLGLLVFLIWGFIHASAGVRIALLCLLAICLLPFFQVHFFCYRRPKATPYMRKCLRELKKADPSITSLQHEFVSIDNIDPILITMADVGESRGCFMYERGFIGKGYIRAHLNNIKGTNLRGGSTISQQTAKNIFLPFTRKRWRKIIEVYYTFLIELHWGKKKIMEYYLNFIEYGHGIFGCQAACRYYFGHDISHVTPEEACMLVTSLAGPKWHNPNSQTPFFSYYYNRKMQKYFASEPTNLDNKYPNTNPELIDLTSVSLVQFGLWFMYYETKRFFQKLR